VFNANNCSNDTTAETQVQINPLLAGNAPTVVPTASNVKACNGSVITLSASGFINGGAVTGWVYSDNGGAWTRIPNAVGASINHGINVTGLVTRVYRALVLTGCTTDSTSSVTVVLDVLPAKPQITNTAGTDSLVSSVEGNTYEWRLNGNIIPGATSRAHVATVSGAYTVQVANTADCKTTSDSYLHAMVGLEQVFANTQIVLYPNPTLDGKVVVICSGLSVTEVSVTITNIMGQVIFTDAVETDRPIELDLSNQQGGLYFVTLGYQGQTITRKIMNQR
jgi:hypothetical protein